MSKEQNYSPDKLQKLFQFSISNKAYRNFVFNCFLIVTFLYFFYFDMFKTKSCMREFARKICLVCLKFILKSAA